jgi:hypothetical protein
LLHKPKTSYILKQREYVVNKKNPRIIQYLYTCFVTKGVAALGMPRNKLWIFFGKYRRKMDLDKKLIKLVWTADLRSDGHCDPKMLSWLAPDTLPIRPDSSPPLPRHPDRDGGAARSPHRRPPRARPRPAPPRAPPSLRTPLRRSPCPAFRPRPAAPAPGPASSPPHTFPDHRHGRLRAPARVSWFFLRTSHSFSL